MNKLVVMTVVFAALSAAAYGQQACAEAKGDSCIDVHDTFHALRYYAEAVACDSSAALQRKIARCHYMRGDYRRCVDTMLPVAGFMGDSLSLEQMRWVFESYRRLDDHEQMVAWGRAILRRCPMDGEVTAAVAAVYNTDDAYLPSSAMELTDDYLKADSTCIPVLRQNADAQFLMKDFGKAIAAYNKAAGAGRFHIQHGVLPGHVLHAGQAGQPCPPVAAQGRRDEGDEGCRMPIPPRHGVR